MQAISQLSRPYSPGASVRIEMSTISPSSAVRKVGSLTSNDLRVAGGMINPLCPRRTVSYLPAFALSYRLVQTVMQTVQNGYSLIHACQQAAQQAWDGRFFSAATIEEWHYGYKRDKFAALQNHPGRDRGVHKAIDPATVEALLQLRQAIQTRGVAGQTLRRKWERLSQPASGHRLREPGRASAALQTRITVGARGRSNGFSPRCRCSSCPRCSSARPARWRS